MSLSNNDTTTTQNGLPDRTKPSPPLSQPSSYHPSTTAIHADDDLNPTIPDIAPPIHISSTFRYSSDPTALIPAKDSSTNPIPTDAHIYSRLTTPTTTRAELLLHPLLHSPAVCYSSGLAGLHALYCFLNPRRIAITGGYHGSHGVVNLHRKLTGATILPLDCPAHDIGEGDVVHLETPINPTGEALNIALHAAKAHARGAILVVDSTFGPPGLQDPFVQGADVVMHSGTKYLGGHSDLLWGVLATNKPGWVEGLRAERTYLGNVMGGLEAWLGVRSLRTLEIRVRRQSDNAVQLVEWLDGELQNDPNGVVSSAVGKVVAQVKHASLQTQDMHWLRPQMPGGFGPVFALMLKTEQMARHFPSNLQLFHHATSLGGVESLVEWRAMSDTTVDTRLLRISVGIEHFEDLRDDLANGFRAVAEEH